MSGSEEQVIVEPGRKEYTVSTGTKCVFRRVRSVMTVSFHLDPDTLPDQEFPRFVLKSDDGAYRAVRAPKDDLDEDVAYLRYQFGGLLPGKTYTLERWLDEEHCEVVFERVPWVRVVDQPRDVAEHIVGSSFAKLGGGAVEEARLDPDEGTER
jgi:hypothetical protein